MKDKFEWWCRVNPLKHRQSFKEENWEQERENQPKCCGVVMSIQHKREQPIKECPKLSCVAALNGLCRCYACEGKFHGAERWRNHHLVGTQDEYLIHQKLEVVFKL